MTKENKYIQKGINLLKNPEKRYINVKEILGDAPTEVEKRDGFNKLTDMLFKCGIFERVNHGNDNLLWLSPEGWRVIIENNGSYEEYREYVKNQRESLKNEIKKSRHEIPLIRKQNKWFYTVMIVGALSAIYSTIDIIILNPQGKQDLESVQLQLDSLKQSTEEHISVLNQRFDSLLKFSNHAVYDTIP